MQAREALRLYGQRVGPENRAQNMRIVERWLRWGGQPTDAHLASYAKHLADRGLASGTVDKHLRIIRAFYAHLGIRAPRKLFRHDPAQERRPTATDELVRALVQAARDGAFSATQVAYLALGTTYGLRVGEIAAVDSRDVDRENGRIFIRTEKGGVQRWMHLPDAISRHLDIDWIPRDPDSVNASFGSMLSAIGVERRKGDRYGMHILRRGLVLALRGAGVPDDDIAVFMRWAQGGRGVANADSGIGEVARYSDPSALVYPDREIPARPVLTPEERDSRVWASHPWLPMWG